jgi:hypothetical protein
MAEQPQLARAGLDLETVVRRLHSSDIRVGLHTFDRGIFVWISDRTHRVRKERVFKQSGAKFTWVADSAALWLHEAALRLFPGSPYARGDNATAELGKRSGSVGGAANKQPAGPSKSYRLKGHKVGNRS